MRRNSVVSVVIVKMEYYVRMCVYIGRSVLVAVI